MSSAIRRVLCVVAPGALGIACCSAAQAWTLKTLYSFCIQSQCADGSTPLAGVVRDSAGNLYGTTEIGGAHNQGVVFQLSPQGKKWSYKVLHDFCYACGDGAFPTAKLIVDVNGNLYGTTAAAGPNNMRGTVFRLSPDGSRWTEKILHVFTGTRDGDSADSALTYSGAASGAFYDGVSALYGNTAIGGAQDRGTVFAIMPGKRGWHEKILYSFCPAGVGACTDGENPAGDMTIDAAGNLYGLTGFGGANGGGALYQLAPGAKHTGWQQSVLYSFCSALNCTDGTIPAGPVTVDGRGHLFGTTTNDEGEGGVVFEVAKEKGSWQERVLHTFCCEDGYLPMAGVMIDPAGRLFGTNAVGGPVGLGGTVFELNGKKYSTLYNFCSSGPCTDGAGSQSQLVMDAAGNLYGTTAQGGPLSGAGTVFELSP
jgi:uncharacterized repeat protein (TIGR03803 family)